VAARATLVLLPGMEGSGAIYGPLVEAAPPGIETLSVSYPAGAANGYDDLMPLCRAALPRGRPFHLLGWSFSGPLALRIAAERPPGLRGVVLASSFVRRPSWVPAAMHRLARPWLFKLYPPAAQLKALLGRQDTPELRRLLREAHALAGAEALAGRVRAAMTVDAREALRACVVPILYLRATRDEVVRARCADEVRALAPATEIVELPGSHLTLIAAPAAAWAALLPFLERTRDGAEPSSF
jgi:pimeloyl-ACP methyl ester carboxylesterase